MMKPPGRGPRDPGASRRTGASTWTSLRIPRPTARPPRQNRPAHAATATTTPYASGNASHRLAPAWVACTCAPPNPPAACAVSCEAAAGRPPQRCRGRLQARGVPLLHRQHQLEERRRPGRPAHPLHTPLPPRASARDRASLSTGPAQRVTRRNVWPMLYLRLQEVWISCPNPRPEGQQAVTNPYGVHRVSTHICIGRGSYRGTRDVDFRFGTATQPPTAVPTPSYSGGR